MRLTTLALGALGIALGIVGIATAAIPVAILGLATVVVAAFFQTMKRLRSESDSAVGDSLTPESRTLLRPLRKLHEEVHAIKGEASAISPFLASEARTEADRLLQESATALGVRDRLVRQRFARHEAEKRYGEIEQQLGSATTDDERESLRAALDARSAEIGHYAELEQKISQIESSVRRAEASLAELKARMSVGAVQEHGDDELRQAVGRTKALSDSLQEVQDLTQEA